MAGAIGLVLATWTWLPERTLPVLPTQWAPEWPGVTVRGAYHVHTRRSDGMGTVEDAAAAAGRAGLDFLVLTDHGDATRTPDPPRHVGSVLVIDAVEISTRGGHYAALGLPGPAPYRLAGDPRDVVEDVARLGGRGFVTHPDSPKASLAWRDWSIPVPGFEWLNADSEWRDEGRLTLARALLTYPWRPVPTLVALLDRPAATLARWDGLMASGRYLVAIAGADAHARLGLRDYEDDGVDAPALPLPTYESSLRSFSTAVLLDAPLGADPAADAARVVRALGEGRSYTVIDGVAGPARFEFVARTRAGLRTMGESVPRDEPVTLVARALAPPGTTLRILRNGEEVAASSGLHLVHETSTSLRPGETGAGFRVEAVRPGGPGTPPVPWLVSNPIFVERPAPPGAREPARDEPASVGIDLRACRSERDPVSASEEDSDGSGDRVRWAWRLAGSSAPAWVALSCAVPPIPGADAAIAFRARADAPIRVSIQLREPAGVPVPQRWQRTAYLDADWRQYRVALPSLAPVERGGPAQASAEARTLLFVVDWTHGLPGMRRTVEIERAGFEAGSRDIR
jgi:hypothetical protein